ncbi:hypothetical protein [Sulfuracidifex tepidarius]|nr:hypothetical protein [Sulfuracidifex tepidarius]
MRNAKGEKTAIDRRVYVKNNAISSPISLALKIGFIFSLTEAISSGLIFAYFVDVLHVTTVTSTDIVVSFMLEFIFETLAAILILPRIGLFKEVKPGEVKIIGLSDQSGGLTMEFISLSRSIRSL